ncbi:hypothetical protein [Pseudonocardia asaccharolytica]|uniref:hypothetical protein n=1 Tax=Pseudonocardia asaccharolytica TaxID=54010 RepID=UPI00041D682F|nr:hypothetical protein [Pseudonocardia asaccharolytica]
MPPLPGAAGSSLPGAGRPRRRRRGRLLSLAGTALAGAGATLGGHLGYHQAVGANRGGEAQLLGPGDWRPLGR